MELRNWNAVTLLVGAAALTACSSTMITPRYSISASNVEALRAAAGSTKIGVAPFSGDDGNEIGCRMVSIKVADGQTPTSYLQNAFIDELRIAGIYDARSPIQLSGRLSRVNISSTGDAHWDLALSIHIGRDPAFSVERRYQFDATFFDGVGSCHNAAQAFLPAVQDLINAVAKDPRFAVALSPHRS